MSDKGIPISHLDKLRKDANSTKNKNEMFKKSIADAKGIENDRSAQAAKLKPKPVRKPLIRQ